MGTIAPLNVASLLLQGEEVPQELEGVPGLGDIPATPRRANPLLDPTLERKDITAVQAIPQDERSQIIAGARKASQATGVPFSQIMAVAEAESSLNPRAVSKDNAQGLMQLIPSTAHKHAIQDAFDIEQNLYGGALELAEGLKKSGGDLRRAYLEHYNPNDPNRFKAADRIVQLEKKYANMEEGAAPEAPTPTPAPRTDVASAISALGGEPPTAPRRTNPLLDATALQRDTDLIERAAAEQPPPQPGLLARTQERIAAAEQQTAEVQQRGAIGLGEAALGTATAIGGFFTSLGQLGSKVLNSAMQRIAERGPITARTPGELVVASPEGFYTSTRNEFQRTMREMTYEPRSEEGKRLMGIVGFVPGLIMGGAEAAKQGLVKLGASEDNANAIALSAELLGFLALDPAARAVVTGPLRGVRSSIAKINDAFGRARTDADLVTPEVTTAAKRIADAVEASPEVSQQLQAARQQLIDTLKGITEQLPERLTTTLREGAERPAKGLVDVLAQRAARSETEPAGVAPVRSETEPPAGAIAVRARPTAIEPTEVSLGVDVGRAAGFWEGATGEARRMWLGEDADIGRAWSELSAGEQARVQQAIRTPVEELVVDTTPSIAKPKRAPRHRIIKEEPQLIAPPEVVAEEPVPSTPTSAPALEIPAAITYEGVMPDRAKFRVLAEESIGEAEPISGAVQIRRTNGKPDALLIDETGLGTATSLESIRGQVARGRMSAEVGQALEAQLRHQSEVFGVPLERAHQYTGERLLNNMMQLAGDRDLALYRARRTKTGLEYDEVPREAIKTALAIRDANPLEPVRLTKDGAATYVAEKTRPVGEVTLDEIARALEKGEDISPRLPADMRAGFQHMLEQQRAGVDTNEIRTFMEVLRDIADVIAPPDTPPTELGMLSIYGLTPKRKEAALRLWADAQKKGRQFRELMERLNVPESEQVLMQRYIDSIAKPLPPQRVAPPDMRLNPYVRTDDPVVWQRTSLRDGVEVKHAPLYFSEVEALQRARELPQRGVQLLEAVGPLEFAKGEVTARGIVGEHGLLTAYNALRRAELLDPIQYAYRASERAGTKEWLAFNDDITALARVHNKASRERIGQYGYGFTEQGMNILVKNGKDLPQLNAKEQATYGALRELFDNMWLRINEVREMTGREPLDYVEDYIPFMRMMSMAEKLSRPINLLTADSVHIFRAQLELGNLQMPRERARTGATYRAEFDAFKLAQDFMRQATRQIHMEPFLAKLRELIDHPLPDLRQPFWRNPETGVSEPKMWNLADEKPKLYENLSRWHSLLEHGVQPSFGRVGETIAKIGMSNAAAGYIALSARGAMAQIDTIVNTWHAVGPAHLAQGIGDFLAAPVDYFLKPEGKTRIGELYRESQVLDTRGIQDAYNDVSAALIGRSPKDFLRALKSGELRQLPRMFGAAIGYKFMEIMDHGAATIAGLSARRLMDHVASQQMISKDQYWNYVDDVIVRTQGGTMPGDVAAIQRTTAGRLLTQAQRFLINDWNYFVEDVLGAAGHKEIARMLDRNPDRYVPAVVKSALAFVAGVTASNIFYEDVLKMRAVRPSPLRALVRSINQNDNPLATAGKVALEFTEPLPVVGSTRYGKAPFGMLGGLAQEALESVRGEPLAYKMVKPSDTETQAIARMFGSPVAKLLGIPGSGQIGRFVRGQDRGQGFWPSLMGFYDKPVPSGALKPIGSGIMHIK